MPYLRFSFRRVHLFRLAPGPIRGGELYPKCRLKMRPLFWAILEERYAKCFIKFSPIGRKKETKTFTTASQNIWWHTSSCKRSNMIKCFKKISQFQTFELNLLNTTRRSKNSISISGNVGSKDIWKFLLWKINLFNYF